MQLQSHIRILKEQLDVCLTALQELPKEQLTMLHGKYPSLPTLRVPVPQMPYETENSQPDRKSRMAIDGKELDKDDEDDEDPKFDNTPSLSRKRALSALRSRVRAVVDKRKCTVEKEHCAIGVHGPAKQRRVGGRDSMARCGSPKSNTDSSRSRATYECKLYRP